MSSIAVKVTDCVSCQLAELNVNLLGDILKRSSCADSNFNITLSVGSDFKLKLFVRLLSQPSYNVIALVLNLIAASSVINNSNHR